MRKISVISAGWQSLFLSLSLRGNKSTQTKMFPSTDQISVTCNYSNVCTKALKNALLNLRQIASVIIQSVPFTQYFFAARGARQSRGFIGYRSWLAIR